LAALPAATLVAGTLATAGVVAATPAGPAGAATPTCTYNGLASGSDMGTVTPGTTTIDISCSGLTPSGLFGIADASPLAQVSTGGLISELNLTMGLSIASADANGNLSATFTVPTTTVANDADGTCPPSQAQIDAGLNNCAVAVANISTGVDEGGFALLNYPGQPTPDPATLTLSPSTGPKGSVVTVSGSNWWGDGTGLGGSLATLPPSDITVGGVAASASSVTIAPSVYTPGTGANGAGGTLTGGAISGTFTLAGKPGLRSVVITEPNPVPAGDPPYSGATISASAPFTVVPPPSITTVALPNANKHAAYHARLRATGGTTPYTWSLSCTAGTDNACLPAGTTLNAATGKITGTPTAKGRFTFVATVTDSSTPPVSASRTFSFKVLPGL